MYLAITSDGKHNMDSKLKLIDKQANTNVYVRCYTIIVVQENT